MHTYSVNSVYDSWLESCQSMGKSISLSVHCAVLMAGSNLFDFNLAYFFLFASACLSQILIYSASDNVTNLSWKALQYCFFFRYYGIVLVALALEDLFLLSGNMVLYWLHLCWCWRNSSIHCVLPTSVSNCVLEWIATTNFICESLMYAQRNGFLSVSKWIAKSHLTHQWNW